MGAQAAADGSAWAQAHLARFEVDVWVEDSCDEASLGRLQWVRLVDIELNLRKTSPHHHPRGSHEHPERTKHGVPTRMLDAKEILGGGQRVLICLPQNTRPRTACLLGLAGKRSTCTNCPAQSA